MEIAYKNGTAIREIPMKEEYGLSMLLASGFLQGCAAKHESGHDDDRAVELKQPEESWGWIVGQGAKLIQTDRPALLLEYLRAKKLHK